MGKRIFSDTYNIEKNGKYYSATLAIELVESVSVKKDPLGEATPRLVESDPLREKVRSVIEDIIKEKVQ